MLGSFSSNILTVSITLNPCLAHEGQEIIFTPLLRRFKDFKISLPILTSLIGSSDKDIGSHFLKYSLNLFDSTLKAER